MSIMCYFALKECFRLHQYVNSVNFYLPLLELGYPYTKDGYPSTFGRGASVSHVLRCDVSGLKRQLEAGQVVANHSGEHGPDCKYRGFMSPGNLPMSPYLCNGDGVADRHLETRRHSGSRSTLWTWRLVQVTSLLMHQEGGSATLNVLEYYHLLVTSVSDASQIFPLERLAAWRLRIASNRLECLTVHGTQYA